MVVLGEEKRRYGGRGMGILTRNLAYTVNFTPWGWAAQQRVSPMPRETRVAGGVGNREKVGA